MTHEECQDRLLEFAYGELDRRRSSEVRAHLADCPTCAGVYRRIAGVREVMGRLEPEQPPGGERVVLAAAREAADRRREERPSLGLPLWVWKASVATVAVAAVAGLSVKIASRREPSQVEEIAAGPERQAVEAPGTRPLAAPPPSPAEGAPASPAPGRPAMAARVKERPPSPPATAPAPSRVAFAEKGAADAAPAEAFQAPPAGRRAEAVAEPPEAARRKVAAARAAPARANAAADAESKAAAPTAAGAAAFAQAPPPEQAPAEGAPPQEPAPPEGAPAPQAPPPEPAPPEGAPAPPEGAAPSQAAPPAPAPPPAPAAASRKDPRVKAAQAVAQDVESRLRHGKLSETVRAFQACGPAEDAERRLYADATGRVVKYVRQVGSAEAALTYEEYYDAQGRLRHVYLHGGAVNGAVVEHRIWLDGAGTRLREEQRFRRGRYPFPESWPDSELRLRAPDGSALGCGAP